MGARKVYIAACGIGLGHIGRMAAVADRLSEMGAECVFSTYGPAYQYIKEAGYEAFESAPLMWEENEDGSVATGRTLLRVREYARIFRAHLRDEEERIRRIRPDAVVSDSRYSTLFLRDRLDVAFYFVSNQLRFLMPRWREGLLPLLAGEMISRANYHWLRDVDSVLVPDFPPPDTISRENMQVPDRVLGRLRFMGPLFRRAPEELPEASEIRRRLGFGEDLFVFAAISGPGRSRQSIVELLTKVLPAFRRNAVIDRGEPGSSLEERRGEHLTIRGWSRDRFELLKACDVVVSRPGLTTISEILRFGKPSLLIPTPNQSEQEGNARSMEAHGAARVIAQRELSERTLNEALEGLTTELEEYKRRVARLQKLVAEMDGPRAMARAILGDRG